MNKKAITAIIVSLFLAPVFGRTHVFWYKAKTKNYKITDCNPGPCLPKGAAVHEGMIVSGSWSGKDFIYSDRLAFGSGSSDLEGKCAFIWSSDLNRVESGSVRSAKLRGEFNDFWYKNSSFCTEGPISIRCGVVDFKGNLDVWKKKGGVPEDAMWADKKNPFSHTMGFKPGQKRLQAEEIIEFQARQGKSGMYQSSPLNGQFFEIDITDQVNWILNHHGQFAIIFIVEAGKGNTGMVLSYSAEHLPGVNSSLIDSVWTKDGNTTHLVLEEHPNTSLMIPQTPVGHQELLDGLYARWVSPTPFSIIRGDSVRVAIEVGKRIPKKNIEKVIFYATYFNLMPLGETTATIAEVPSPPYEAIWDCREVPDQNLERLVLSYDVLFKRPFAGDSISGRHGNMNVGLDRNPEYKEIDLISYRIDQKIGIDGDLREWSKIKGVSFSNNDNHVTILSYWDEEMLYFGIQVLDQNVISSYPPGSQTINPVLGEEIKKIAPVYEEDEIEIFLDPLHNHNEIMDTCHFHYLLAAAGMAYGITWHKNTEWKSLNPGLICSTRIMGTSNNQVDKDTGYVMECGIPWGSIGLSPRKGLNLGLEFFSCDRDSAAGKYIYQSWSGVGATHLQNPSEWGNLILGGTADRYRKLIQSIIIGCGLLFIMGWVILIIRKRKPQPLDDLVPQKPLRDEISKAMKIIAEHFHEEDLNRDKMAEQLFLNPSYFSSIFKKEMGIGFNEFLTEYRIKKAEELLMDSNKNISQIALNVGFGSLDYFGRIFKKLNKLSPKDFRNKNLRKSNRNTDN